MVLSATELQENTIFLRANNPLDVGTRLKLTISLAGKTLTDAYGVVLRSEPFRGFSARPSGMAVQLYDVDTSTRQFMEAMTRQKLLSGKTIEGIHVETFADRIAAAVSAGPDAGPLDPLLARAGFQAGALRPWEAPAFYGSILDEDLEVLGSLREAVALIYKLRYHAQRYRELVYVRPSAAAALFAHSEKVLARAEGTGDVLSSLSTRLTGEGQGETAQKLATTQAELLRHMVEIRTLMDTARRSTEAFAPTVQDEHLCPESDVKNLLLGLSELFDFTTPHARKEHARTLNPEIDLSELSGFEVIRLMEARQQAATVHPDVGAWARALAARHIHLSEFLRYRKPGREVRPDRVEEVVEFSKAALGQVSRIEERFRPELQRLASSQTIPRADLEDLSASNHRMLIAAAKLSAYYNLHAPSGAPDYTPRLIQAAEQAARVVPPRGGATPLPVSAGRAPAAPEAAADEEATVIGTSMLRPPKPPPEKPAFFERLGPLGEWIEDFGPRRLAIIAGAVLVLAGGSVAAILAFSGGPEGPDRLDVQPFASILPLQSCEIRESQIGDQPLRTLRCAVKSDWKRKPRDTRRDAVRELLGALSKRKVRVDQVLLLDAANPDNTLGFGKGEEIEVFE
jgi:hypothetical protein